MAPNSEVKFVLYSVGVFKNAEAGVSKMYIPKLLEQHRGRSESVVVCVVVCGGERQNMCVVVWEDRMCVQFVE